MDQEKKPGLFSEFPPISTREWEEKIQLDLRGADYEKRLVWKTNEGIVVNPYYRAEHLEDISHMGVLPGQPPYVRGMRTDGNDWVIRQDFDETDPVAANRLATQSLEKGAGAVGLNASELTLPNDLVRLLEGIDPETTPIHFTQAKDFPLLVSQLKELYAGKKIRGSLNFDPLGYLVLYGKFFENRERNFAQARVLVEMSGQHLPGFSVIGVNGQYYHNAGASLVQEVAFTLSQANEYLAELTAAGLPATAVLGQLHFRFGVGSGYFLEIARLRAAKMLWATIAAQYQDCGEGDCSMRIQVETSDWNKTVYDPYVNMLRTTTEAMAAALSGVESITVKPFDSTFKKPDAFSYRMARNQQIILKEEAYFNKVADPAGGSYYIEKLTESIAQAAWALFLETEQQGGFIKSAENGFIRSSIAETCQQRDMDIALRKRVFVGTNKYPDTSERMLDKMEPTARLTDLSDLKQYRGAQSFEALRLAVENHAKKSLPIPRVFHFTYGDPVMRKARASFSANFFGVAGYQIINNIGFTDLEAGAKAALDSGAEIVVFCSSDEEYASMVPTASQIKEASPTTQVVVAGNPSELIDELTRAGVDHFIHIRTNVLRSLTMYNELLGIA